MASLQTDAEEMQESAPELKTVSYEVIQNLNMPVAPINGSLKNNSTIESIYFTNLEPLNDSLVLTKMENLESALLEIVSETLLLS